MSALDDATNNYLPPDDSEPAPPALDQSATRPAFLEPRLPGESPTDTGVRQQKEDLQVQRQQLKTDQTQQKQERMSALDFASRGVPTYKGATGTVQPVTDSTGAPLTNFQKKSSVAWDSIGNPQKVNPSPTPGVAPKLSDPYADATTETDKKGNVYKVAPGLPWKWDSTDADIASAAAQKERDDAVSKAATALGGKLSLDQHAATSAQADLKTSRKKLDAIAGRVGLAPDGGPGAAIYGALDGGDAVAAHKAIDAHFNSLYGQPEANATKGVFSDELSPAAQQIRSQLDSDKAAAHAALQASVSARMKLADSTRKMEATRAVAEQLQSQRADAALQKAGLPPLSQPPADLPGHLKIPGLDAPDSSSAVQANGVQGDPATAPRLLAHETISPGTAEPSQPVEEPAPSAPITGAQNVLERTGITAGHAFEKGIEGALQWAKSVPQWAHGVMPLAWLLGKVSDKTGALEYLQNRTQQQEAALRGDPVRGTSGNLEQLGTPSAAGNAVANVAGGLIGSAPGIVMGGIPGLLTLGTQAAAQSSAEAHDQAKAQGASDDDATKAGTIAALKTLPTTIMFAGAGGVTGKILKNIVPLEASPLTRAAASLVAGTGVNVAAGTAGKAVVGENPTPTLDDVVNSVIFAAHGASTEHQRAQDLATAKSIITGQHPEMAVMNGIAEGAGGRYTPEQQAAAVQYANALRAVAADFIEKSGYKAPQAGADGAKHVFEKPVSGREVSPEGSSAVGAEYPQSPNAPAQRSPQEAAPLSELQATRDQSGSQSSSPSTPAVIPGQVPTEASSATPEATPAAPGLQTPPGSPQPAPQVQSSAPVVDASQQPAKEQDPAQSQYAAELADLEQRVQRQPVSQTDAALLKAEQGRIEEIKALMAQPSYEQSPTPATQEPTPGERGVSPSEPAQPGVSAPAVAAPAAEERVSQPWDEIPGLPSISKNAAGPSQPISTEKPAGASIETQAGTTPTQGESAPAAPISGPALVDEQGNILHRGELGQTHGQLKIAAAKNGVDATEATHALHVAGSDTPLSREEVAARALQTGQIDQATHDRAMARTKDRGLHSQDLGAPPSEETTSKPAQPGETKTSHEQATAKTPEEVSRSDEGAGSQSAKNAVRPGNGELDGLGDGQRSGGSGEAAQKPHSLTDASSRIRKLARGAFKHEFARLQTELYEGDAQSYTFATTPDGERITFNPTKVAAAMDFVRARGLNADAWVRAVVHEELIHARQLTLWRREFQKHYADLWKSLPKSIRDVVESVYTTGGRDTQGQIIPHIMGAEHERLLAQYRETGTFSELLSGEEGADKLKAFLDAPQNELVEKSIASVESLTAVPEIPGLEPWRNGVPGVEEMLIESQVLATNEPNLTPKGTDTNVTQDAITGANTHLSGRAVDRETAQRISETNESRRRALLDLVQGVEQRGAMAGSTGGDAEHVGAAISRTIGQPLLSAKAQEKILNLPTLGESGSEGIVTTDGTFAYKLYLPRDDAGKGIGLVAQLQKGPDGRLGLVYRRGHVQDILDKASVLSHLGMPTEVLGVVDGTGEVITKQPIASQSFTTPRIVSQLHEMGARPVRIAGTNSHFGNWMVNVAGRHYIVTDLSGRNVRANTAGIPRMVDVVLCPLTESDFKAHPDLAEVRDELSPLEGNHLFANEPGDKSPAMPEDKRAASKSGQPSPSGHEAEDYRGEHGAPDRESGAPLHNLTGNGVYPEDVYSSKGLQYYGTGYDALDRAAHSLAERFKNKPNSSITIYRSVPYRPTNSELIAKYEAQKKEILRRGKIPNDADPGQWKNSSAYFEHADSEITRLKSLPEPEQAQYKINPGDWVTPLRKYAVDHGAGALNGQFKIISKSVPAKHIFTAGDSWLEWGYDPSGNPDNRAPAEGATMPAHLRIPGLDEELKANDPHHSSSQPRDEEGNFVSDSTLGPIGAPDVEKMVRDYAAGRSKNRSETLAEKQARKDTMLSAENRLASKLGVEPKVEPTPAMKALAVEVAKHKEEEPGAVEAAKEVAHGIVGKLKEIKHSLTELPQYGPVLKATNEWQADLQRASKEAQDLADAVIKKAPDALTREAITNWRQAGGDIALLAQWASATLDPKLKAGYMAATELSADHKALARDISSFYREKLALGQEQEMLQEGVANYATQIWVDDNGRKLPTGGAGKFKQLFAYSNPRQFDNFFEGEQLAAWAKGNGDPSFKPLTKDAAALLGIYSAEFNKVLASRNYVRKLVNIKDADGRQVVGPSSMSKIIGTIKPGEKTDLTSGAFNVNREKGGNMSDYGLPDHPAFQKWRFLEPQYKEDPEGLNPPVATGNKQLMMGNLVVHPKHFRFINNVLGDSAIRKWLNEPSEGFTGAGKATISGILRANGFTKGLMFMGSPFHAIHVGKRALGSWVNPFSLGDEIDFSDPMQRWAIEHGLVVHGDRLGQQQFIEGLGTDPVIKKIPVLGPMLTAASDFTFHTYIPRMKMKCFSVLLQRKMKTFAKELADGRVTVDQLGAKAAYETNNIFGHMNYSGMGRNKTVQQVLSMLVLAPDFTESTFRHYGDAFTKHGGEARRGLLTLAIGTLVVAKIINALLDDGDPHLDHPFSVVVNNREYSLRSPITDLVHLYKDWWSFAAGRQSPFLRGLIEFGSGKNWRGEPVSWSDAARDIAAQPLPMTLKALPGLSSISPTDAKSPIKGFEQFVTSLGIGIRRYSPSQDVYKLADQYLKYHGQQNPKIPYPQSKYANLKYALFDAKIPEAKKEYQQLVGQSSEKKVVEGFHSSLFHPVMMDKVMLADFLKTLNPAQQKTYRAAMTERDQAWRRFQSLRGTVAPKPAPAMAHAGLASKLFSFD